MADLSVAYNFTSGTTGLKVTISDEATAAQAAVEVFELGLAAAHDISIDIKARLEGEALEAVITILDTFKAQHGSLVHFSWPD